MTCPPITQTLGRVNEILDKELTLLRGNGNENGKVLPPIGTARFPSVGSSASDCEARGSAEEDIGCPSECLCGCNSRQSVFSDQDLAAFPPELKANAIAFRNLPPLSCFTMDGSG